MKSQTNNLHNELESIVNRWVNIIETPAPSGHEADRATIISDTLRIYGFEVSQDAVGNVIGTLCFDKSTPAPHIVLGAHMDTVFPMETDVTVTRNEGRLYGPGAADDASGVAALLEVGRLISEQKPSWQGTLTLLFTVWEETGLKGSTYFAQQNKDKVDYFVAVDGSLGHISYAGLNIHWLELIFTGPGGHTLKGKEIPRTSVALAETIIGIHETLPFENGLDDNGDVNAWVNPGGMISGGSIINAQPQRASVTVDLRTTDNSLADRMTETVQEIARQAAAKHSVELSIEEHNSVPAASLGNDQRQLHLQNTVYEIHNGLEVEYKASAYGASDHNPMLFNGIPAICMGVVNCSLIHTTDESVEAASILQGIELIYNITMQLLTDKSLGDS